MFDGEQLLRRAIVFCIEKDKECSPVEKMLDEKLNHLSIMSIESGVLRKLDFSDIISEFVKRKARKMFY